VSIQQTAFRDLFEKDFAKDTFNEVAFQKALIKALTLAFRYPPSLQETTSRAVEILDQLFSSLVTSSHFSFAKFIQRYFHDQAEIKAVACELLYGLYYGDIDLSLFRTHEESVEYFIIQTVAEKVGGQTLRAILNEFSLNKTVRLIAFCASFYREGSFKLFNTLSNLRAGTSIQKLIFWLKRNYIDRDKLANLLKRYMVKDEEAVDQMLKHLEKEAQHEVETIHTLFKELIDLMLDAFTRAYNAAHAPFRMRSDSSSDAQLHYQSFLPRQLQSFIERNYSVKNFQEFCRFFGLCGYAPLFMGGNLEGDTLLSKIISLHRIFTNRLTIGAMSSDESYEAYSFVLSILHCLEAIVDKPMHFKEGLELFSVSLVTSGKTLSQTPALLTLLQGYSSLFDFLRPKCAEELSLRNYPIFVFDQSEKELFTKNQAYIEKLNQHHESRIVHVSQNEALEVAQKLGIEGLLNTTKRENFGYGGARNCQFLLTGILRATICQKKMALKEVLAMKQTELVQIYNEHVLGGVASNPAGDSIYLVDDDVEIPAVNLFTAALFAKTNQNQYVASNGFQTGRYTKSGLRYWGLQELLEFPENLRLFPEWFEQPIPAGLSEQIGKPKFCLNIPHGGEERHLGIQAKLHVFMQASKHLCGSRYPTKQIPTTYFVGLQEYLKGYIPYVFLVMMSTDLLDSMNKAGHLALPWNDKSQIGTFSSLRQVFHSIKNVATQQEMKERFLRNVRTSFDEAKNATPLPYTLGGALKLLIDSDVSKVTDAFLQNTRLTPDEKEHLMQIAQLYSTWQQDAKLLWQLGTALVTSMNAKQDPTLALAQIKTKLEKESQKPLSESPLTEGFYLLSSTILTGEFCKIVGLDPTIPTFE